MFGKQIRCTDVGSKTLVLSSYGKERLAQVTEWFNDPEVTRHLSNSFGYSPEQEKEWFDRISESPSHCHWGIFWDGKHIGNTGLAEISYIDRNAVYGIVIGEQEAWGKGIATEVISRVATYAFNTLNLEHIYSEACLPNQGSRSALERAGFKEYGCRPGAKFIDGEYYSIWESFLSRSAWLKSQ